MVQIFITLIILIIIGAIIFKIMKKNRSMKLNNWTLVEADLGGRKTTVLTRKQLNMWRERVIINWLTPTINIIINIILFIAPIVNIFYIIDIIKHKELLKIKKRSEAVYSTFPIWLDFPFELFKSHWTYSYAINADVLDWKYKIEQDSFIVFDEIGYIFPSETKKTDPKITFCMTWFRHATNATVLCATQSMSEVNITFRRKCNKVYQLSNGQRCMMPFGLWFSKVQVRQIIISEDVNNIYEDNYESRNENWYTFKYPRGHFDSRYGKELYNLSQDEISKIALKYQLLFEKMNMHNGDKWTQLYYEIK